MISANGGLPAHRYTPQVTQRWPRASEPAEGASLKAQLLEANSQCEPTGLPPQLSGDLWCPNLGQSAWKTGGLRSRCLHLDCMGTPPCMAFVVMGRGRRRP